MLMESQERKQTHYSRQGNQPWRTSRAARRRGWRAVLLCLSSLAALGLLAAPKAAQSLWISQRTTRFAGMQLPPPPNAQQQQPIPPPDNGTPPTLTPKQKQDLLKSGFAQMKKDTDQLLELAKSLQKDIDKGNENVLSIQVVGKAEKIEKLAKKIKNTARGY